MGILESVISNQYFKGKSQYRKMNRSGAFNTLFFAVFCNLLMLTSIGVVLYFFSLPTEYDQELFHEFIKEHPVLLRSIALLSIGILYMFIYGMYGTPSRFIYIIKKFNHLPREEKVTVITVANYYFRLSWILAAVTTLLCYILIFS